MVSFKIPIPLVEMIDERVDEAADEICGRSRNATHLVTKLECHVDNNTSHALKLMLSCLDLCIVKRDTIA